MRGKSVPLAVVHTLFFGPLELFYVRALGAVTMVVRPVIGGEHEPTPV